MISIPIWTLILLVIPYLVVVVAVIIFFIVRMVEDHYDRKLRNKNYGEK